jgi:hypothetical protein
MRIAELKIKRKFRRYTEPVWLYGLATFARINWRGKMRQDIKIRVR